MAAGLGFKDFVTGEVLTAADVDGYLMQGIWVFASAAARDSAVTSPQEGNFAYLKDTNTTTYYTGSAWTNLDTTGMVNPMTTTGDTIYSSSGSTPARLGIGTAGQVLQVNSGATAPEWVTPASGGGMTLISETVASGNSSISFSSLGSYKQLFLMWSGIYHSTTGSSFGIRLNNSSTASTYEGAGIYASGGAAGNTGFLESYFGPSQYAPFGYNNTSQTLRFANQGTFLLDNYTSSTKLKSGVIQAGFREGTTDNYIQYNSIWNSTAAVTSIDIVRISGSATISNVTNTSIRLYGIS